MASDQKIFFHSDDVKLLCSNGTLKWHSINNRTAISSRERERDKIVKKEGMRKRISEKLTKNLCHL